MVYLIKEAGRVVPYQELFERFCELEKLKEKYNGWDKSFKSNVYRWFSDIKKRIKDNEDLNIEEKIDFTNFIINVPDRKFPQQYGGYKISGELSGPKYCLIETKHIESHH